MAAAIHVAYRTKLGDGNWSDWTDTDAFGTKKYSDTKAGVADITINGNYANAKFGLVNATDNSTAKTTTIKGAALVPINLSEYTSIDAAAPIDQIEIVIYIAGKDSDCVDSAKNGKTFIGLFFGAQEDETVNPQG